MPAGLSQNRTWRTILDYGGLIAAIVLLVGVFSLTSEHFLGLTTFQTIANQVPSAVLTTVGMTLVLILGGIDLSVGSILGFSSTVAGVLIVGQHWPAWAACLAALCAGTLAGAVNGAVAVAWRLPTFIVTLGMLEITRGAAHLITHSQTQYVGPRIEAIAATNIAGISLPFLLALAVVALGQLTLTQTVFGRWIVAIGTNEEAARLSGVDPRPVRIAVFALSGLCAGMAGVIDTSRFSSASPNAGTGFELQVIAAAVIGGTSLMGGRGSVVRSFFGVLIIAILNAGLASAGVKDETKRIVTGAVIIGAVIVDQYRCRFSGRKRLNQ